MNCIALWITIDLLYHFEDELCTTLRLTVNFSLHEERIGNLVDLALAQGSLHYPCISLGGINTDEGPRTLVFKKDPVSNRRVNEDSVNCLLHLAGTSCSLLRLK